MANKIKILVTSIGSLVGQNIQDVLEFTDFRRREMVELIGTNSIASCTNNFRCDRCYLVSDTCSPDFKIQLKDILLKEKPDLVLSGRDEDAETVALLLENNRELPGKLPYGNAITLKFALNKWETSLFCNRYNLPFAETLYVGRSGGLNELKEFIEKYGYPLIAKPVQGYASKGVFFIRDWHDVQIISKYKEYIVQEYLGNASTLEKYFNQMDDLTPLFAHAPNIYHHSCHTVIAPDGSFDPIFISRNEHDSGVTIGLKKVKNQLLEELTEKFVRAIYKEGGYGPLTVQFREDKNGNWKAQEINMRTNGNTFPRFVMGQDDIGLIIQGVLPEINFPVYKAPLFTQNLIIGKTLTSYSMKPENIQNLKDSKFWENN
jgi:carbamoylphosphate synthase large subunit